MRDAGVLAAIEATCRQLFASAELAGRSISVVGLGSVSGEVARRLVAVQHFSLDL